MNLIYYLRNILITEFVYFELLLKGMPAFLIIYQAEMASLDNNYLLIAAIHLNAGNYQFLTTSLVDYFIINKEISPICELL